MAINTNNYKNLYSSQHEDLLATLHTTRENHIASNEITYLYNTTTSAQNDSARNQGRYAVCENGTIRIRSTGIFRLGEDIVFTPNANVNTIDDCMAVENKLDSLYPTQDQMNGVNGEEPPYPPPYNFGFFAAITIEADNVELDLNGYNISQSSLHYIQQRFFSLIQLNPAPFIINKGPLPSWKNSTTPGSLPTPGNIRVHNSHPTKGGVIGRSSHHGILGNKNVGVLIENITFQDYEVAAIALNGAKNCLIRNVVIQNSARNVPVNFLYSNAIYTRKFLKSLLQYCPEMYLNVRRPTGPHTHKNGNLNVQQVICNLQKEMFKLYNYIEANPDTFTFDHPDIPTIFQTKNGLPEGNIYAIVLNRKGPVVADFVTDFAAAEANGKAFLDTGVDASEEGNCNNILHSITITNIDSFPREVIGLTRKSDDKILKGVSGNIFPILEVLNSDGTYGGNVATDATLLMGKCKNSGDAIDNFPVQPKTLSIDSDLVSWAENGTHISSLKTNYYYTNFIDQMDHYMKGNIMMFISGANTCKIDNIKMKLIQNTGLDCDCGDAERDADYAYSRSQGKNKNLHFSDYRGRDITSLLICGSYNIDVNLVYCNLIKSPHYKCNGVLLVGGTKDVKVDNMNVCEVDYNSIINMHEGARRGVAITYDLFKQIINRVSGTPEKITAYLNANKQIFINLQNNLSEIVEQSIVNQHNLQ